MATIQVCKNDTGASLGKGNGSIDTKAKTAVINTWTEKAGLVAQRKYTLKSGRKTYADATCTAVNAANPVATFSNVS